MSSQQDMEAYVRYLESKEDQLRHRLKEIEDWSALAAGEITRLRSVLRGISKLNEVYPHTVVAKEALAKTTFEPDLGREYAQRRVQELIAKRKAFKGSVRTTEDPEVLAGEYLNWAQGNLAKAIQALARHASGQYLDMPPFPGVFETLALLKDLD